MSDEGNFEHFSKWLETLRETVSALKNNNSAAFEHLARLSISLKKANNEKLEAKQEERLEMEVAELWEVLMALPRHHSLQAALLGTSLVRLLVFVLAYTRRKNDPWWLQNGIQIALHATNFSLEQRMITELDVCISACQSWLQQWKMLKNGASSPFEAHLYAFEIFALNLHKNYAQVKQKINIWRSRGSIPTTFQKSFAKVAFNIGLEVYNQERDFASAVMWFEEALEFGIHEPMVGQKAFTLIAAAYLEWNGPRYYQQALKAIESAGIMGTLSLFGLRLRLYALLFGEGVSDAIIAEVAVQYLESLRFSFEEKESYVYEIMGLVRSKRAHVILLIFNQLDYTQDAAFDPYRWSLLDFHLEALVNLNQSEEAGRLAQQAVKWKSPGSMSQACVTNIVVRLENEAASLHKSGQVEEALGFYGILINLARHLGNREHLILVIENAFICALHCTNCERVAEVIALASKSEALPEKNVLAACAHFHLALLYKNLEQVKAACCGLDLLMETEHLEEAITLKMLGRLASSSLSLSQAESTAALLRSMAGLVESPRMQITFIQVLVRLHLDMLGEDHQMGTERSTYQDIIHDLDAAYTVLQPETKEFEEKCFWFARLASNVALQAASPLDRHQLYLLTYKLRALLKSWGNPSDEECALVLAVACGVEAGKGLGNEPILRTCLGAINGFLDRNVVVLTLESQSEVDNTTVLGLYKFYIMVGLGDVKEAEEFLTALTVVKAQQPAGTLELLAAIALGQIDNLAVRYVPQAADHIHLLPHGDDLDAAQASLTLTARVVTPGEAPVSENLQFLAVKALRQAINNYTLAEEVNYGHIARNYHYLIDLLSQVRTQVGTISNSELPDKLWTYCTEAVSMAQAAGIDHYPVVEVAWLIARIWNIGIDLHFRGENKLHSQRWCQMAWDLAQCSPVLQSKYECKMRPFLENFAA